MTAGSVAVPTIVPLRAPIPGQHKTSVDSNTKIELHSDTNGAEVYYTVNGSKPDPFQPQVGSGPKNTHKYRGPICLSAGRRTVKAVAVGPDEHRVSNMVTKTFEVSQAPEDPNIIREDGLDFVNDLHADMGLMARKAAKSFAGNMVTSREAWAEVQKMRQAGEMMADMTVLGSDYRKPTTGPRFMDSRKGSTLDKVTIGQNSMDLGEVMDILRPEHRHPDTATQALRMQRETDFLKCIYCFAPRPSDPFARFCNECGNPVPPIPQTRLPPPEPGQMGMCVECHAMVPFNTPVCLVCEAPMPVQNQPQASLRLAEKLVCPTCGTANPADMLVCVTCETRLPSRVKPIFSGQMAPPVGKHPSEAFQTCSKCGRVNSEDARFCDWCGAKPSMANIRMECSKCGASNQPLASFCASCGVHIQAPQRSDIRNAGFRVQVPSEGVGRSVDAQWLPVTVPLTNKVPTKTAASQTVGLFYPSQREISKKIGQDADQKNEADFYERKPVLSAVSPGRGYWRKQMDHICAHLKAHAANNAEFRSFVAEPKMGKILSASVHEDGHELSLTVNFALRGTKDPLTGHKLGYSHGEYLSKYTNGSRFNLHGSVDSLMSGENTTRSAARRNKKKKVVKKTKKKQNLNDDNLTEEDRLLLKEIGKNGEGRDTEIQILIDDGADPSCRNKDDVPALHIAVKNKHVDAIPILVQGGADVSVKSPVNGNTPLHEAVSKLGSSGGAVIDILLKCGADPQKKNGRGDTAIDLAVKAGLETISRMMTTSLAQPQLKRMTKPKTAIGVF